MNKMLLVLGLVLALDVSAAVTCRGDVPGTLNCTVDSVPNPVPAPAPVPAPTDPFAACPAGTIKILGQWGNSAIETRNWGVFNINILTVEVKVPSNWAATSVKVSSWGEYGESGATRDMVLSHKACDFSDASAVTQNGWPAKVFSSRPSIAYKREGTSGTAYSLTPGQTYYLNFRNRKPDGSPSCRPPVVCGMRGGLPQ